eukprot:CAMPEP_0113915374 /NCGR_PEP_ID=MMETSP0780_2-20120614/31163_1 /TAXON_ID=652834 /ORGANISM="Palpitomonas bilix" /LENGTH=282 /DNA_ID=CAMNT_0000913869 /DNA_START=138 /DNA_END=986 /DNA_ORIENTATION=+ /assembly_acc=CAM_ASM_000599
MKRSAAQVMKERLQKIENKFNEVAKRYEDDPNPSLPPLVASASDIQEFSIVKWKRDVGGGISYYHFAACALLHEDGKVVVGEVTGGQEGFNNFLQDKRDARVQLAEYSLYSSKFKGAEFDSVTRDPQEIRKICNRLSTGLAYWNTIAEKLKEKKESMETMYNLVVSNCEHFARWVCTGKWCSMQAEASHKLLIIAETAIIAVVGILDECAEAAKRILDKTRKYIKKHPVKSALIGVGLATALVGGIVFAKEKSKRQNHIAAEASWTSVQKLQKGSWTKRGNT